MWRDEGVMPKALKDRPVLLDWLEPVFEAFNMLSASRPYAGMDGVALPIPFSEIACYIKFFMPDLMERKEDLDFFIFLVRTADHEYLDLELKERKKNTKKAK